MTKTFASAGDLSEKAITFKEIGRDLYAFTAEGDPNSGIIVGDDGVIVVDAQATPALAGEVIARVRKVTDKKEWPSWTPPAQMLRRRPDLPRYMPGGIDNPLGARAMYLGGTLYRIHGSNEPETIGQAVSSGCFRLTNDDVVDLYNRVRIGATVIVQ